MKKCLREDMTGKTNISVLNDLARVLLNDKAAFKDFLHTQVLRNRGKE